MHGEHHMTGEEFRQCAHRLIDWIIDYQEQRVNDLPVLSRVSPGYVRASLPAAAPSDGESFDAMLRDVDEILLPGITHWQSPRFFAFFPANTSYPAILGELLSAGLGVQGMLWTTSPACTELETHVLDWVADMLDLPPAFRSSASGGGVIEDSASSAALCAMIAARERATEQVTNRSGIDRKLVAYASSQVHSSVQKAAGICGIGKDNLRAIAVDDAFALRPDQLEEQIHRDRGEGTVPFFVCATVGTTSSLAFDPLPAIGEICRREGLWLHVDGAMAGTAAVCPEYRHIHDGLDLADSYCFNPHKWMFTNFDCDCFYVADRAALIRSLSILPEYLRNRATESGSVIDYRDWQISLGRRFRALKLWFVIRHYGVEGLRDHVRQHIGLAQEFRGWIEADNRFELAAPAPLNLVCFRHRAGDDVTRNLLDELNNSGDVYMTHTVLNDRFCIRFCVGQTRTGDKHVAQAWQAIDRLAPPVSS